MPTRDQAERISLLQEQADLYTRRIEAERRTIDTLQRQMAVIDSRSSEARRKTGGHTKARDVSLQYMRQVKVLENRLEKSMVKLNEALQRNKELRLDIDNLRRERLNFQEVYRKMERELGEKKREMASIIEISNIAYEARDQAQNEIAALRAQADREQAAFEHEMAELNAVLEADLRVQEAERQKALLAVEMAANPEGMQTTATGGVVAMRRSSQLGPSTSLLGRKNSFTGSVSGLDRRASLRQIPGLEDAFQQLSDATGLESVEEIVEQIMRREDGNFQMFEHNQDLSSEIEKLEEALGELRKELDAMKGKSQGGPAAGSNAAKALEKSALDASRKELVKELEDRAAKVEGKETAIKGRTTVLASQLDSIKKQLTALFNNLGCDTPDVRAQHAEILTQGVTDSNMLQYLGIIERRATDILAIWTHKRGEEGAPAAASAPSSKAQAQGGRHHEPLEIQPPSTTRDPLDDEDGEGLEDEDRPLTRAELKAYASRTAKATTGPVIKERSNQGSRGQGPSNFMASEKLALGRKR